MAKTLKEIVAEKSVIQGDCRLWQGTMAKNNRPITSLADGYGGRKYVDLQLYLARKKFNLADNQRVNIITTCGNPNCISKDHIELGEIQRKRKNNTFIRKSSKSNIEYNKRVFDLIVKHKVTEVSRISELSVYLVKSILANSAMYPYFQLRLEQHLGEVSIDALRESVEDEDKLRCRYNLSRFAMDFIRSEQRFAVRDEDLFVQLLSQCEVYGEHLIWGGDYFLKQPLIKTFGNYKKNAKKLFVYAVTGVKPVKIPRSICNCSNCINPFHME